MEEKIVTILNEMSEFLSVSQMKKLQEVMLSAFAEKEPEKKQSEKIQARKRKEGHV